ncbi:YbbR domain-containing protein [Lactobacillus colini]|uniref:YbbR domain-containing protein n=1 Tax=Lactobacillus colini TaxID=1819254 RepID=A0ABS4MEA6_9LACO|nr:CdaR family protein [Lactobacillus colini]MBP2057707.1 YbbR domain-containing protein [Lactobacillus colini]
MKKFFDKPWFYKVIALLLAVLFAIYINSNQQGYVSQSKQSITNITATKKQTIRVPLQVSVDTDKYYVTGYPEKINLTLQGNNALVTSTINTQNFRVFIDLNKLKVGRHNVKVKVNGLSNQLSAVTSPKTITVNIQKRKSRSLPVQIEYNRDAVPKSYNIGTSSINPSVVRVTGAKSEVNQIDRIVAKVTLPKGQSVSYTREVILVAEDSKGRQLNVVINPVTASVHIPISLPHKKVKVTVTPHHEADKKIYSLTADKNEVVVYGKEEYLKKLKSIPLDVDLSGIGTDTVKNIPLKKPEGIVRVDPEEISVKIKVSDGSAKKE